jgi:cytochrome P450
MTTTLAVPSRCPFHAATAIVRSPARALTRAQVPGPRGAAWASMHWNLLTKPLPTLRDARERYGDVVRVGMGPLPAIFFVASPEGARQVLLERADDYVKSRTYDGLKCFVGEGLLTNAGGEVHRERRRLAAPAFHPRRVAGLTARMAAAAAQTVDGFAGRTEIDMHAEMTQLTLNVVGRTLFNIDLSKDEKLASAFDVAIRFAGNYAISPIRLPLSWPLPWNRRFLRARATLDAFVDQLIAERRAQPGDRGDLMSTFMEGTDGGTLDDVALREEVMTMVGAGHETTAAGMAWLLSLLAEHPEIQERAREEVRRVLGDRRPEPQDLEGLEYIGRVVQEALRMRPPIWMIERTPKKDDTILGHRVPAGSTVAVSPYLLQHHPAHWEDPDRFDPDRFLPAAVARRDRHTYLPFGAGPRVCIGARFASLEMQLITAMILARYRLEPTPGRAVEPEVLLTLRPRGGAHLRLTPLAAPPARSRATSALALAA